MFSETKKPLTHNHKNYSGVPSKCLLLEESIITLMSLRIARLGRIHVLSILLFLFIYLFCFCSERLVTINCRDV